MTGLPGTGFLDGMDGLVGDAGVSGLGLEAPFVAEGTTGSAFVFIGRRGAGPGPLPGARGFTGRAEMQARGETPCWERSRRAHNT